MKQVCVKADDSQAITAIYEFLHDLDNEYSNFSKWYYSTVVPGLASGNRIIYTVLDDEKIVAVLILKNSDEKKICTLRVAEHYRCQGIATKLLKIAHQALQCTNPLITVSSIHINEFEFLLKKNGFTLYKKYENYYKQGIVEYAFNGLLPEKQNNCRLSQNVV